MQDLNGKVAVITGGASGIGLAVAKKCAEEGMKLVLADIDQEMLDRVSAEFQQNGTETLPVVLDISAYEQVEALAKKTVDRFGKVPLPFQQCRCWCRLPPCGTPQSKIGNGPLESTSLVSSGESKHLLLSCLPRTNPVTSSIPPALPASSRVPAWVPTAHRNTLSSPFPKRFISSWSKKARKSAAPSYARHGSKQASISRSATVPRKCGTKVPTVLIRPILSLKNSLPPPCGAVENDSLDPSIIAEHVIDAVRDNRFYILTHPKFTGAVAYRMKDLLNGNNPRNLMQ